MKKAYKISTLEILGSELQRTTAKVIRSSHFIETRKKPAFGSHSTNKPSGRQVCKWKVRYRDQKEALQALHRIQANRSFLIVEGREHNRRECRVYVCPTCMGAHLTSKPSSLAPVLSLIQGNRVKEDCQVKYVHVA